MLKCKEEIITKDNLVTLRDFIQKRTGIFFTETKFFALEKLIHSNFIDSQCVGFTNYLLYLNTSKGERCFQKLISLLTTNETFFFRGKAHFDLMEKYIFPELISKEAVSSKTISIWSAGCSTGEEPYSIAILLKKLIYKTDSWNIRITASDIDETPLSKARKGKYSQWSFRGVSTFIIDNCFIKEGDDYKIKEEYKPFVHFTVNNLISDPPPFYGDTNKKFDLIICRNVTIYFDKQTTMSLASKFYNSLRTGGYLIVGHAEHSAENYSLFKTRAFPNAIIYQKMDEKITTRDDIPLNLYSQRAPKRYKKKSGFADNDVHSKTYIMEADDLIKLTSERKLPRLSSKDNLVSGKRRNSSSEETHIFIEAMLYYDQKNYDLAIDRFLRIHTTNPSNVRVCWMLSHIAANRGFFEEAIAWANRCIEIDPLYKESYYTLSLIHLARNEFKEAENKIKKAIYIDQYFVLGYFVLGNIYVLMQLPLQAEKYFKMTSDMLVSKSTDEIVFQIENLTVGELLNLVKLKERKT